MNPNDYLKKVLSKQALNDGDPEIKDLCKRWNEVAELLRESFPKCDPSIRWAGSKIKGTMIRDSYDGDMTSYFPNDDQGCGNSLAEIYENTAKALETKYEVQRKSSALRVKDRSTKAAKGLSEDTHIDVVPGRYTDEKKSDVFLHQNNTEKTRLKTNLQTHIDHIGNSGVLQAIRLLKLWNVRNQVGAKTFILELLAIKLLGKKKQAQLSDQLEHCWTVFRDHPNDLAVEDPANPTGNDLKPALDQFRSMLSSVARITLANIARSGWESVFGPEEEDRDTVKAALVATAAAKPKEVGTKPWLTC